MRPAIALALVLASPFTLAQNKCHEMDPGFYASKRSAASDFFAKSKRFPVQRVVASPGLDCGDHAYFDFEAKPEFNNVGYHWEVRLEKSTGRMSMVDGI